MAEGMAGHIMLGATGVLGGPFAGIPDATPASNRRTALELAVKTVVNTRQFTVGQVINTADAYEKYLTHATVPPLAAPDVPVAPDTLEEGDSA